VAINAVIRGLRRTASTWSPTALAVIAEREGDPFRVLIACILSLRTQDTTTGPAAARLFAVADTPERLLELTPARIAELIYPVGFYRTKARSLRATCRLLLERHAGQVPRTLEELLELPGVGRKTANLVLTIGHDEYGICVDTHVHRITNLWGYVSTRNPDETELALRRKLPRRHWKTYNDLLVTFGQNLCVPVSPWCSRCPVSEYCERVGLRRSR